MVKLRDAAQMMADAANEYLERQEPTVHAPTAEANNMWNPEKIVWNQAQGSKGTYERSEDTSNPEFKALLKELEAHNGKLTHNGYFYWKFSNSSVVGRKKRK